MGHRTLGFSQVSGASRRPAPAANTTPARLSDMRFTRWWNPSLPQTLIISVWLLYADAVFTILALLGTGFGSSAYVFVAPLLFDVNSIDSFRTVNTVVTLIVLASAFVYGFAALGIANGQKIGWKAGVGVAAGAVILPIVSGYFGSLLTSSYVITYLFNIALLVALLHPQSRDHQRTWFEGPSSQQRRRR